jgi:non-ribosomal peptide synthetase component F
LSALYESFAAGVAASLPALPIQYADYAAWQRNWLRGEVLEAHLSYWKGQLAGTPGVLELPTDRPRPAVQTFRGAMRRFNFSAELSAQIAALSRREGATPFMTMLAAFNVLLSHYSHQLDVIVGCNIANRNRGETERLIGFFVNLLPLRADLTGEPDFHELLRRTRQAAFGAYAHQDLPFDKLVAEILPGRDLSRMPLVQVVFNFQNAGKTPPRVADLTLDFVDTGSPSATFDLTLHVEDTPQGITGELLYSTDLFDAATMARLLAHYEMLLASAAARPDLRLSELKQILSEDDAQQQLRRQQEFKQTKRSAFKNVRLKPVSGAH